MIVYCNECRNRVGKKEFRHGVGFKLVKEVASFDFDTNTWDRKHVERVEEYAVCNLCGSDDINVIEEE